MREIKFRAWIDGKMIYINGDISIEFFDAKHAVDWMITDRVDGHSIYKHDSSYPNVYESNKLMQFIGKTDKNGKDIYDDDVLNVKCKDGGMVEWTNHLVQWEHIKGYIGFWIPEQTHDRPGEHEYSIEIMGNIHQDPDWITKFVKL